MGSRGASSGAGNKHFKFSSASDSGKDNSHEVLPAYANVRIKNKTLEAALTLSRFSKNIVKLSI